jgi:hypothetical protein
MSFPQLFAKGKSLKPVGIDMPQDKYKGQHGEWAMPNQYYFKGKCSRFRPIYLLSSLSKVFERLVADQLLPHLQNNNLINKSKKIWFHTQRFRD